MTITVLKSVFASGGRAARRGDYTIVYMHGSAFITTAPEFMQQQTWARSRMSTGNPTRDRTMFVDRFETVLARVGCGLASKGNRGVLSRIVKAMKANAMFLEEWAIPHDLNQSVEMKKKVPVAAADVPVPVPPVPVAGKP